MPVKSPHVIWASVVIIFMLIAGTVLLVLADKDVSTILTLTAIVALPVLTALGVANYQKSQEIKEVANGNVATQHKMIQDLQATVTELALKVQPPEKDVSWKDDDTPQVRL